VAGDQIAHLALALPGAADRQQARAQEFLALPLAQVLPVDHLDPCRDSAC
jgi:hypothetical protein